MTSADIAIQIVNYKTKAYLGPLLESIVKDIAGSELSVEINILDNASGDDLEDVGKKWRAHNVHIYMSDTNGGFGAGHNLLATKTTARYLLILNPDMVFIEATTIARLVRTIEATDCVAVGPRLLIPSSRLDVRPVKLAMGQLKQQPWDQGAFTMFQRYHAYQHQQTVDWISGGAMLLQREAFEAVGGFDQHFFLYFEELDLCRRLHKKGGRVLYDPDVQILHYGSVSTGGHKHYKHLIKSFCRYHLKRLFS